VVKVVLQQFNESLPLLPLNSWRSFCKMCKRVVSSGYNFASVHLSITTSKSFVEKFVEDEPVDVSAEEIEDIDDDEEDEISLSEDEANEIIANIENSSPAKQKREKGKAKTEPQPPSPTLHQRTSSTSNTAPSNNLNGENASPETTSNTEEKVGEINNTASSSSSASTNTAPSTTDNNNNLNNNLNINNNNEDKSQVNNRNGGGHEEVIKRRRRSEEHKQQGKKPRIAISPLILQEFVTGLRFCMFREEVHASALAAVRGVHLRACHDLVPQVILSANSLLHLNFVERHPQENPANVIAQNK